jgi:transcriptional regulator with XRE-family HTH domain
LNQKKVMFNFDDEDKENPIGSMLRYYREQKKLDLGKISEELKVRLEYLKAMEQGRFDLLPSGFYRKSFLKAYAEYLKIDSDQMLRMLEEQEKIPSKGEKEAPPVPKAQVSEISEEEQTEGERLPQKVVSPIKPPSRESKAGFGFSIFFGLIIGALCLVFLFKGGEMKYDGSSSPLGMAQAESLEVTTEPPDTLELFNRLLDERIGSAPQLILRVEASGRSWIRVISDGIELYVGFVSQNMSTEFKANESLSINLGVNEGVKAFLNGFEMMPLEKGITYLDRENFREFIPTDRANEIVRQNE